MPVFDTIVALATPPYRSALALVRLSGSQSLSLLSRLCTKDVRTILPNHAYYAKLYQDKETKKHLIDEAVFVYYKGPHSYTGFDSVEFSVHGNPLIVEDLIDTLVSYGARRAKKGEFSAQAYYNGKMDLLKAEGINDLILAKSERAREIASSTLSGKNTEKMESLKRLLLDDMSQLEYYVEDQYSKEKDDYDDTLAVVERHLSDEIQSLSSTLEATRRNNKEYEGFSIAIAGKPNVGKSTLLNALLGQDKAIVSPVPGTTRDVVDGEIEVDGILYRFLDTAGIRSTSDLVENLGIERSYQAMEKADLVLFLSDQPFASFTLDEEARKALGRKPYLKIATKRDLRGTDPDADLSLCALSDPMSSLFQAIQKKLLPEAKEESAFLGKREEDGLQEILSRLISAKKALLDTHSIDIVSDELQAAIHSINQLTGKDEGQTMEDIYQTLFSKFCLGK